MRQAKKILIILNRLTVNKVSNLFLTTVKKNTHFTFYILFGWKNCEDKDSFHLLHIVWFTQEGGGSTMKKKLPFLASNQLVFFDEIHIQ